ncbi:hypothetical protein [Oligoflexus tunisiensis]|uniref:hypothetical protein n=1 Tax=Oligoflexus tunisiensis TaxID=708132 RepID=UPI001C4066EB|nr:hypothetical protein [Oligoflexus tunisiensis]
MRKFNLQTRQDRVWVVEPGGDPLGAFMPGRGRLGFRGRKVLLPLLLTVLLLKGPVRGLSLG